MVQPVPIVLVPGLTCTARLFAPQLPALWPFGPVTIADHGRDDTLEKIAARILANAPPSFALVGLSMGGYIAFAMLRLAPERITRLALLDTSARADKPEQTAMRKTQIAMAHQGRYGEIADLAMRRYLHANRQNDESLTTIVRQMGEETGAEAFIRQMTAIMTRPDSRARYCPPSNVRHWCWSATATWPPRRRSRARSRQALPDRGSASFRSAGICRRWNVPPPSMLRLRVG